MPRLLVVHHTSSPTLDAMLEAVLLGARDPALAGVEVVTRAALAATASDLLGADGVIVGTPANMGYMAGGVKVFFDSCYYPALRETRGIPYAVYVHGNSDVAGATRSVDTLATGLGWSRAAAAVEVVGPVERSDRDRLTDLGGTVAATLLS